MNIKKIIPLLVITIAISLSGCGKAKAQWFKNAQSEPTPEISTSSGEVTHLQNSSSTTTETLGVEIFNAVKQIYSLINSDRESQVLKYMVELGYSKVDYGQYYYSDALGDEFVKGGRIQVNKGQDRHFIAEKLNGHTVSTCIGTEDGNLVSVDVCFYNEEAATDFLQFLIAKGFEVKKNDPAYGVVFQHSNYCLTSEIGYEKSWDNLSKDYIEDFTKPIFIFRFYSEDFFH